MPKILIVDDETEFIRVVQVRLEANGYEVITANDGEEGLEKAESEHPDLILLDIVMPKMNGYSMLKEVRKNEKIKDISVILCSGKIMINLDEDIVKAEADAYLAKPFDSLVYLTKIRELLKKSSSE